MGSRALLLGSLIGGGMGFLRWAREHLRKAVEARGNQDEPELEGAGVQDLEGALDDGRPSASSGRG